MSTIENTMLTSVEGYEPKTNMVFDPPQSGSVPNSTPEIRFKRINIKTKNPDGSEGELVMETPRVFSFGVSENVSQESGKITGYTFPLCLYTRDNPSPEEITWVETFDKIVDVCIDHLVNNREEIDQDELTKADLTKSKGGLNPLYWKREKVKDDKSGKMVWKKVPGQGPTLYTKLIFSKKNDKFVTQVFDVNDEPLEIFDLMGKYCYTKAAVKIESIFISGTGKISLQVKLYEAVVEPSASGMKRLLSRPKARPQVLSVEDNQNTTSVLDEGSDDEGSLVGSDTDTQEKPAPTLKKPVRRVKKAVVKP